MKKVICAVLAVLLLGFPGYAQEPEQALAFDIDEQLDALGRDALEAEVPEEARALMQATGTDRLTVGTMLALSPGGFVKTALALIMEQLEAPVRTLAAMIGVMILCALANSLSASRGASAISQTFSLVGVLCVLASVITPVLDCVVATSDTIKDASLFMLSYIPVFSAALAASGSPITGASYSVFLFSACQVILQIVGSVLIPLMGIYLALCIMGSLAPDIDIGSATRTIRSIVSWTLGFFLTIFVGILSIQTMVAQSADSVTARTAKFMLGSFVPVVGSALSEAFSAAQGCLKLLKTTLGAYGVIVAVLTFLPVLVQTVVWYMVASLAVVAGDIIGVRSVSGMLRSCAGTLGILIAVILSFALLVIVSTTVVMLAGIGTA